MGKLKYEKPVMLVEGFVPTQSVAASCGESIYNVKPIEVGEGDHTCSHTDCKQGHKATANFVNHYDSDDDNLTVNVFSAFTGCTELIYGESKIINKQGVVTDELIDTIKELGMVINENGSWGSTTHPPVLGGVPIPS